MPATHTAVIHTAATAEETPRGPLPRRTLVGELLATQLVFAAVLGLVAVVSVWSVSDWVVRHNLATWARQWIEELDSLGSALYLSDEPDRYLQVEHYAAKFPEIAFVRYYDPDGKVRFTDSTDGSDDLADLPRRCHGRRSRSWRPCRRTTATATTRRHSTRWCA